MNMVYSSPKWQHFIGTYNDDKQCFVFCGTYFETNIHRVKILFDGCFKTLFDGCLNIHNWVLQVFKTLYCTSNISTTLSTSVLK